MTKPTPPRGTTRVPAGSRPADQIACPGCSTMISRNLIACKPCWRTVPGDLKTQLGNTTPGTFGRARVVAAMRSWLKANNEDTP